MSIQVKNLTHIYNIGLPDETKALDDVSFEIADGESAAIIGHTGSGKSTLIQHLNGLLKATSGTITVNGTEITSPDTVMRDVRRKVGLVFQYPEYQLFEETVAKDVAFGPKNLGLSDDEINERVKESLDIVGLDYESIKDRSPFELSGGQKRRVAIAGIVAMKPEVLILDEPTAGLDPGAHADIIKMIRGIRAEENVTIIFVSHNMGDVAELSDKVIVMDEGKIFMTGTPREVFSNREKLAAIGLDVPPAAELMHKISECGVSVRTDLLCVEEAEEEILRILKEKRKGGQNA
ncbi:MAG: energy-coupling factor transporter ATPase [Eubacterium sp.]|jgi:energy-coupling factor transport system ATP-binding protein